MSFGYNLGPIVLELQDQKYGIDIGRVGEHLSQVDQWTDQLEHVTNLLAAINNAKKANHGAVDLSDEAGRALVDAVRATSPHLISDGVYSWSGDATELVLENLNSHAKKIGTFINPKMMRANQGLQDIAELIKVFHEIIKQEREEKNHYVNHQNR